MSQPSVLEEAINRMADRIQAAIGEGNLTAQKDLRTIVSDLDMDVALVKSQLHQFAEVLTSLWAVNPSQPLCCMITDQLAQAFATGIMHERIRAGREAGAR